MLINKYMICFHNSEKYRGKKCYVKNCLNGVIDRKKIGTKNRYVCAIHGLQTQKVPIDEYKLRLRTEGRDYFKHELLLDIERMEKNGYEARNIVSAVINLLKY